jgi:hypothetical protein
MAGPRTKLPISPEFPDAEAYISSLLSFSTSSPILQTFTGRVHILDFLTRTPDLYSTILPADWRAWFDDNDIHRILDLLLRDDLAQFSNNGLSSPESGAPPASLLEFISAVRRHTLTTAFTPPTTPSPTVARSVLAGMSRKKEHEVRHFAGYIARLTSAVAERTGSAPTHVVDFGSGCSYLGRYLAAAYGAKMVAVEDRAHVLHGARRLDISAGLAERPGGGVRRNKKAFVRMGGLRGVRERIAAGDECPASVAPAPEPPRDEAHAGNAEGSGSAMQYVEHRIESGDLSPVFARASVPRAVPARFLVVSLHSCGNLVHHGLRTLTLNASSVVGVCLVGCCYNLATESLGPPTYKLPGLLRTHPPRLRAAASAADPHGFPMSRRLRSHAFRDPLAGRDAEGVRMNITARMMAVQAPANWSEADSARFFTRHFFRALLQRVMLDLGLVPDPSPKPPAGRSPAGTGSEAAAPLVIGGLAKGCYADFPSYVRGAAAKLARSASSSSSSSLSSSSSSSPSSAAASDDGHPRAAEVAARLNEVTDEALNDYEERFRARKKQLSVTWSLMAFCAQVSEAVIVCDRYVWLTEQKDVVGDAWVESVFDYALSPRNMAVVGIRKADS